MTSRVLTKAEVLQSIKRVRAAHRVWHDFCRRFMPGGFGSPWKYVGYDLARRVERWAEKYPEQVKLSRCDDDHHMSSVVVLIESSAPGNYHGVTAVVIPQAGEPFQFFLYLQHLKGLRVSLNHFWGRTPKAQRQ